MTTEIAVINRLGVALAADSAVTISGFGTEKVFDTGDKLFELSHSHSVAVMVNGNLDFLGVPWELIIKDFRKSDPDPLPTSITGWSSAFLNFVLSHRAVKEEYAAQWITGFADQEIYALQGLVLEKLRAALRERTDTPLTGENLLELELIAGEQELHGASQLASIRGVPQSAIKKIKMQVGDRVDFLFGTDLPHALRTQTIGLILKKLRTEINQDSRTGLVICGFGGDDLFPSLHAVVIDGVFGTKLRSQTTHHVEITRDSTPQEGGPTQELGTAISFAQTDVIERLLRGVDQRFVDQTKEFIDEAVGSALTSIFQTLRLRIVDADGGTLDVNDLAALLSESLPSLYEETAVKGIGDEIEREFKQTISLMPKQELIELAEALVSITAVERKATRDAGTVGGPIDVALITRSEGFVWIKRKHHFSAELNPRYVSRVQGFRTEGDAR